MLVLSYESHSGQSFNSQFSIYLKLFIYLNFHLFISGFKSFTHFILFDFCKVQEKQEHNNIQNSYDFFDKQTANKKLEICIKVLYCKNVFVTIRYIIEYIFYISISNDSLELIGFWLDQLAFFSRREMTGDYAARKNFCSHAKMTCNRFTSLYRSQKSYLSGFFSCTSAQFHHGKVGKGELGNTNIIGDN